MTPDEVIRELQLQLARYQGCMVAISEFIAGGDAPECMQPEPEIVAQQVGKMARDFDALKKRSEIEK